MVWIDNVKGHKWELSKLSTQWHRSSSARHMMQVECCQHWQRCIIVEFCFPFQSTDEPNSCSLRESTLQVRWLHCKRNWDAAWFGIDMTPLGWRWCLDLWNKQTFASILGGWCLLQRGPPTGTNCYKSSNSALSLRSSISTYYGVTQQVKKIEDNAS